MALYKQSNKKKGPGGRQPTAEDANDVAPLGAAADEDALAELRDAEEAAAEPAPSSEFAATVVVAEPEPEAAFAPQIEPVPVVVAAKVVVEPPDGASASGAVAWTKAWPVASFDVWNENAAALMDLASELSKAKTVGDVVTLQSRFANERFSRFVRLSTEIAAFPKIFFFAA